VRDSELNQLRLAPCSGCQGLLQVEVFPAFFRHNAPAQAAENLLVDGESTCFYHNSKRASVPCHACGRFLCALCDCNVNGEHFCPSCLETGRNKGKIRNVEARRTRYDNIALTLATVPLLTFYFTLITAPMAIIVAIRYWNAPPSIVQRTKVRMVLAIGFAALQVLGWLVLIYFLIGALRA
jgi:hypothetical protein